MALPADERVFNPSGEMRHILGPAKAIEVDAELLRELLFAIEGRVSQRKLWGIVSVADRYPRKLVNSACATDLADGFYSYRQVKAATEKVVATALAAVDNADATPAQDDLSLTQEHPRHAGPEHAGALPGNLCRDAAGTRLTGAARV